MAQALPETLLAVLVSPGTSLSLTLTLAFTCLRELAGGVTVVGRGREADIIVDAASGISGAGREPKPQHHFPERNENFEAYNVGQHRHMVEIERVLDANVRGGKTTVIFTPHLVPMERGILSTIYLKPRQPLSAEHVMNVLVQAYENESFVRVRQELPGTAQVARTNFCDLTARIVKSRIVVLSAIDNMVKGAAGQAIQNLNIMFGLDEREGLA